MIPRILLTKRHPRLPLAYEERALCIVNRGGYIDVTAIGECPGDYIVIRPYRGCHVTGERLEIPKWKEGVGLDVYVLTNTQLLLYSIYFENGRASYIRYKGGEEFLRGVRLSGNAVGEVFKVAEVLARGYTYSSFLTYTAQIKAVLERELSELLGGFIAYRERGVKIFTRDGLLVITSQRGSTLECSIVANVNALSDFINIVLLIIRNSRVIHDLRFGRIGESVRTILDIYMPDLVKKIPFSRVTSSQDRG